VCKRGGKRGKSFFLAPLRPSSAGARGKHFFEFDGFEKFGILEFIQFQKSLRCACDDFWMSLPTLNDDL
jgi:hypothetical protein